MNIDDTLEDADWIKQLRWDLPTTEQGMIFLFGADWLDKVSKLPAWSMAPESLKTVAKHGDPSRPNYAQMHPNSPAVNGGFSRRTITKDDVRAQLENYFAESDYDFREYWVEKLLPVLSGETYDPQEVAGVLRDETNHDRNFYHVGDDVWAKTRHDGSPLDVVFSKDSGLTDEEKQEATSWAAELDGKADLGNMSNSGGVTIRVNNEDFTAKTNVLGFVQREGDNRPGNVMSVNANAWLEEKKSNPRITTEDIMGGDAVGRTVAMPVSMDVPVWKYTMTHEWGHMFDHREYRAQDDQYRHPKAKAKNMSAYGRTNPREAYAEAFAQYFLSGGSIKLSTVKWYAEQNAWGSTVKL